MGKFVNIRHHSLQVEILKEFKGKHPENLSSVEFWPVNGFYPCRGHLWHLAALKLILIQKENKKRLYSCWLMRWEDLYSSTWLRLSIVWLHFNVTKQYTLDQLPTRDSYHFSNFLPLFFSASLGTHLSPQGTVFTHLRYAYFCFHYFFWP